MVVVGLAPAAHGANRTGRMFTGDRSGDFLYAALHRAGFANQPTSVSRDDGLRLRGAWITAPVRCAPPANKPTAGRARHLPPVPRAGAGRCSTLGCSCRWAASPTRGCASCSACAPVRRSPTGWRWPLPDGRWIVGSYHVSQQNTFTGKLTEPMLDAVLARAAALADGGA